MKKIYILTAVFALLTLSLNAQTNGGQTEKTPQPAPTGKVDPKTGKEVLLPGGFFRNAPSRDTSTPVTSFPYTNSFSSSEWNWWQTIDVAGDGDSDGFGKWAYDSSNGRAKYTYLSYNDADDWLITAPITLQAGKTLTEQLLRVLTKHWR